MDLFILLGLAVSSVSFTITMTSIFEPFREWISKFHPKLDELFHCPYCLSHYVAILALLTQTTNNVNYFIVAYFAIIAISGLAHYVLIRAYEPVVKLKLKRHLDKLRKNGETDTGASTD